ncbi:hypothetical protein NFI96_007061 [Prochilodus magdalenae]|nr:hypothetical protein NFI96_007061 [Prochilodus magdalenae]
MGFSPHLVYLAILALASHVMVSDAAVTVWIHRGNNLPNDALGNPPDAYVKVFCGGFDGGKTPTAEQTPNPTWGTEFNFPNCGIGASMKLEVWDEDLTNDIHLGNCSVGIRNEAIAMTPRLMCVAILVLVAHLGLTDALVHVWGMQGHSLKGDTVGSQGPYLKVWCGSSFGGTTESNKDNSNPIWTAEFYFLDCGRSEILKLEVWDKGLSYDTHLGTCTSEVAYGIHVDIICTVAKGSMSYSYEFK